MNSELYTAASGLLVEERRLELLSNNLANLSTSGFRAQRAFTTVMRSLDARASRETRAANQSVAIAGTYELPGPGPTRMTGRDLDIALGEDEMLVVETSAGRRYTRAGSLLISPERELTDDGGNPVLGLGDAQQGAPAGAAPAAKRIGGLTATSLVSADGSVMDGGNELGRLFVVKVDRERMRPEGNNLYTFEGDDAELEPVQEPKLRPGWLEGSATDPLQELVRLIEAQRAFESYQKVINMTMNQVNRKATTEIAG